MAERLGSQAQKATLELSAGILATKKGAHAAAQQHLERCLTLAHTYNLTDYLIGASASLADLHLRRGEAEAADPLLAEAEQRTLDTGSRWQLPEIYRLRGEWHLARGEVQQASACASQALALAEELELPVEAGIALRVLAQATIAAGEHQAGMTLFERSLALLADQDPYESARTKVWWGLHQESGPDLAHGAALLQEARTTFERLGARRDLLQLDAITGLTLGPPFSAG